MEVIETPLFARKIAGLLTELEHWELQDFLAARPETGKLIPGAHGLRKLRWAGSGRGKRGGIRVIYYYRIREYVFLLSAYAKSERTGLTRAQLRALAAEIEE